MADVIPFLATCIIFTQADGPTAPVRRSGRNELTVEPIPPFGEVTQKDCRAGPLFDV